MNVGSLFTGCGGLDLGLEQAGHRILWGCDINPACRRVLRRQRPTLPILSDIRSIDHTMPPVDILAGGFPCQDLSYAGRGAGLDGDRSGLWHQMARCVRVLRPRFVIVENVPGLASRGQGRVLYDLAAAGYVGSWFRLRAADFGAPHGRERIFIFAVAADASGKRRREVARSAPGDEGAATRWGPNEDHFSGGTRESGIRSANGTAVVAADTDGKLRGTRRAVPQRERGRRAAPRRNAAGAGDAADTDGGRREQHSGAITVQQELGPAQRGGVQDWGVYAPAIRRWEHLLGRAAPRPTDDHGRLEPTFVEWMLGFPHGWTEGEKRTTRLTMLGNAVQVQCGELIGSLLQEG